MSSRLFTLLTGISLLGFASTSEAEPSWYLLANGTADAATVDGPAQRYMPIHGQDNPIFRDDVGPMQVPTFSGATSATSRGTITYDAGSGPSPQAADGSASLYASVGGLRAAASGANSVGDYTGPQQYVYGSGGVSISWIDTLTFHTDNPLGADFRISVSLEDSLTSTLTPSTGSGSSSFYPGQTSSHAQVHTLLAMFAAGGQAFSATDNFMHIEDSRKLDADHRDAFGAPTLTLTPPPSRTLTAILHVFDGTTIRFEQDLTLSAGVNNGNGTASANASDTAWINLAALDDGASYTSASGTVFATSGDPFSSPVPEPSEFALIGAGLGVLVFASRRRRSLGCA